uniref:Uncharacterized protein MANES_01G013300 n=1 Tax=Rhizophora mucronata TaxID=61149 RepID=A0A2P2KR84_RHIMU
MVLPFPPKKYTPDTSCERQTTKVHKTTVLPELLTK